MIDSKKYFEDSFDEAVDICKNQVSLCLMSKRFELQEEQLANLNTANSAIQVMKDVLLDNGKIFKFTNRKESLVLSYKQIFLVGLQGLMRDVSKKRSVKTILDDLKALMLRKQRDYGKGNITKFEHVGIMVRVSDKIERLINLLESKREPSNESVVDSYEDMANYSLIGIMLVEETFLREVRSEK